MATTFNRRQQLVRDDFWLVVSRFLRDLESRSLEGHNSALVDLFDLDHARRVLKAFLGGPSATSPTMLAPSFNPLRQEGRMLHPRPPNLSPSTDHEGFVDQAVAGLAQEGKVSSPNSAWNRLVARLAKSTCADYEYRTCRGSRASARSIRGWLRRRVVRLQDDRSRCAGFHQDMMICSGGGRGVDDSPAE